MSEDPVFKSPEEEAAAKRLVDQIMNRAQRNYSEGRLDRHDEGDLALAIATDKENGAVIITFGKLVSWIGFNKKQAIEIANRLLKGAAELP